ncbi:MAG: hypothetical protein V2J42_03865 [Wenzhouxiangella sp.]|jgi:hypothetical protein|nr:hypothetical protein [Wenzhouxiangella sp.]
MKNKYFFAPLMASAVVLLGACTPPSEPTETLEERVMARWQLMVEREFEAAWDYYTPGFRQTTSRELFAADMERRPVHWTAAELVGTDCGEDVCQVKVRVEYRVVGAPRGHGRMRLNRTIEDQWVFLDGQWWYSAN